MVPETILVDIDGVVARKNREVLLSLYNEYFGLHLSNMVLQSLHSVHLFEELEVVQTFRKRVGEARYRYLMQVIVYDPRHMRVAKVIAHSPEGIKNLAKINQGHLGYCTARFGMTEQWNKDLQRVTRLWLQEQSFINADHILFCESPRDKLKSIATNLHEQAHSVLLIDDMHQMLLDAFPSLPTRDQEVLTQHLTIGAYRTEQEEWNGSPVRVLPLPQREMIQAFIQ